MKHFVKIFIISLIFLPISSYAFIFPKDALTEVYEVTGVTTVTISNDTSPKTILNVQIMQSNTASNTVLKCGTSSVVRNYAITTPNIQMSFLCQDTVTIEKTGNDTAMVNVTYVPYDISMQADNQFSYGDLFISLLLVIGLIIAIILLVVKSSFGVSIIKKYLGVNQVEGKEQYDI